jgi:hypothetical protein
MLNERTRLVSENLARAINRRMFLKRAGETAFAGIAALVAGHTLLRPASARVTKLPPSFGPSAVPLCTPPGPYCNLTGTNEPNGCHGSSCFQHLYNSQVYQCRVYYTYYQAGCWTTATSGGYWTCCDCECGTPRVATCGCAQFSAAPSPRPDKIDRSIS